MADFDDVALAEELASRLAEEPASLWVGRLRAAGLGAHVMARVEDLMEDPWVRSHGLSLTQHVEGIGNMTMPGVAARLSRTPLRIGEPVRPAGSDAAEVLSHYGLADSFDDLVRQGAISTSLIPPKSYAAAAPSPANQPKTSAGPTVAPPLG